MKKISIVVPTYNEEENVTLMHNAIKDLFHGELSNYEYELIFIDNKSKDNTRMLLKEISDKDENVIVILNKKNFGPFNSPYYGLLQSTGDATVLLCCDFQDPIELIPQFVKEWENGYKIVIGKKSSSKENKLMYWIRSLYYKMIKKMSDVEQIDHFTGFGLYDKSFIETLKTLNDPTPFLRGIVAELGGDRKEIEYKQEKRKFGKSHYNLYQYYDAAMLSFTSYTKIGMRICTFFGFTVALISALISLFYVIVKFIKWEEYSLGLASVAVGLFFLGAVQLIFLGFVGEYVLSINNRVMNRPLVIEECRLCSKKK